MDSKLFAQAIIKFLSGLVIVGLLLFLPAGTFSYWQGWLLMGILFVPMFIAGLVMMKKSPDLLRRRLDVKEQEARMSGSPGPWKCRKTRRSSTPGCTVLSATPCT